MNEEQLKKNKVYLSAKNIEEIKKEFGCTEEYIDQVNKGLRHDPCVKAFILLLMQKNDETK